jgi:hypothetical protein
MSLLSMIKDQTLLSFKVKMNESIYKTEFNEIDSSLIIELKDLINEVSLPEMLVELIKEFNNLYETQIRTDK